MNFADNYLSKCGKRCFVNTRTKPKPSSPLQERKGRLYENHVICIIGHMNDYKIDNKYDTHDNKITNIYIKVKVIKKNRFFFNAKCLLCKLYIIDETIIV